MLGRVWVSIPDLVTYRTVALQHEWCVSVYGLVSGYHRANSLYLDAFEHVYVTGQSASSAPDQNPDFAAVKYDKDGRELWTARYNGLANGSDIAVGISVGADGGIYVAGYSANTNGGTDIVLIKYVELDNIQWQPGGTVLLQFPGTPGVTYRIQASTNLVNWQDIGTSLANTNCIYTFTDTNTASHPHRFYRTVTP